MSYSPLSIFNTYTVLIPFSTEKPKEEEDPRRFDPAKATIYVALVTLIGTLATALITKSDLIFRSDSVEPAMAVQTYKYGQINTELDKDLANVEQQTIAVTNESSLSQEEKVKKYQALQEVRAKVLAVKTALPGQFTAYQRQFRTGDHVAALNTQSEVNTKLAEMRSVIQSHQSELPALKNYIIITGMMHSRKLLAPVRTEPADGIEPNGAELCGPSVRPEWN